MIKNLFLPWFTVDSRAIGIFRILIGWVCFLDIYRRWNYIDVFYSDLGITTKVDLQFWNLFSITGTDSFIVHSVFILGLIFSFFFTIGYKTKISHLLSLIIIISIHGQAIVVGNSGDTFLNCILVWTLFLPLGRVLSIDALIYNLNHHREFNVSELNDRSTNNKSFTIYSIAYFAVLLQISAIYFLSAINRSGGNWGDGTAFYKMHHLDGFITSFGYQIRDYITLPISKIFTFTTLYLEMVVPLLIFIPFYNIFFRRFAFVSLSFFHIMIRLSMHVGLFSQIMISSLTLIFDKKILDSIKLKFINKKKYNLFYDSDCGFCHFTVRIIKRLDVFERIKFCDGNSEDEKPREFKNLSDKTAILYQPMHKKIWTRHKAFGKILSLLPFGFLLSWIFFIPLFSELFGIIYDQVAKNRTKISLFFGLPACGLPQSNPAIKKSIMKSNNSYLNQLFKILSPIIIIILLTSSILSALIEHKIIDDITWKNKNYLRKINRIPRMIQKWKMFQNVPSADQIIIVEATLDDGSIINPFTGKKPILNSTEFKYLMKNKSQMWRKYYEWLSNRYLKNSKDLIPKKQFENWILKSENKYFKNIIGEKKIINIEIYRVSQAGPRLNNPNYKRPVIKTILGQKINYK